MTATTTISVEEFRARARAWLADNVERKPEGAVAAAPSLRGMHEFTKEQIDAERPKQKRLFEAGFAGITWPVEFGGQGLSVAHERAFLEEGADVRAPELRHRRWHHLRRVRAGDARPRVRRLQPPAPAADARW